MRVGEKLFDEYQNSVEKRAVRVGSIALCAGFAVTGRLFSRNVLWSHKERIREFTFIYELLYNQRKISSWQLQYFH